MNSDKKWIFVATIIGVLLIQIIGALIIYNSFDSWSNRGSFGDMFGMLSSLFNALAFSAIIYGLYLQRKDIKITQEEFRQSVKAQQEQAESLKQTAILNSISTLASCYTEMTVHKNRAGLRAFAQHYDEKRDSKFEELEEKIRELSGNN
tara:strand:- start:32216 stop:32662 length:447 start_codon:yes stop_codon:yes gene_type:complete